MTTLVVKNSLAIWKPFCSHRPTRQRCLWERLFKSALYKWTYLLTYLQNNNNNNNNNSNSSFCRLTACVIISLLACQSEVVLKPKVFRDRMRQMAAAVVLTAVFRSRLHSSQQQAASRRLGLTVSQPHANHWRMEKRWDIMDTRTHTNSHAHSKC